MRTRAVFCEIQGKPHHWKTPCKNFKLTEDPRERAELERQKKTITRVYRRIKGIRKTNKMTNVYRALVLSSGRHIQAFQYLLFRMFPRIFSKIREGAFSVSILRFARTL